MSVTRSANLGDTGAMKRAAIKAQIAVLFMELEGYSHLVTKVRERYSQFGKGNIKNHAHNSYGLEMLFALLNQTHPVTDHRLRTFLNYRIPAPKKVERKKFEVGQVVKIKSPKYGEHGWTMLIADRKKAPFVGDGAYYMDEGCKMVYYAEELEELAYIYPQPKPASDIRRESREIAPVSRENRQHEAQDSNPDKHTMKTGVTKKRLVIAHGVTRQGWSS